MDSLDRDDRKPKKAEAKNELIKTRRTSRGQGKPFFFVCFLNSKDSAACCAMFVASRLPYLLKGMAFATAPWNSKSWILNLLEPKKNRPCLATLTFLLRSKRDRKYKCIQRDQLKIVWTYFFHIGSCSQNSINFWKKKWFPTQACVTIDRQWT